MIWRLQGQRRGRGGRWCAVTVMAGGLMVGTVPTDAGQISRPIRDTSSRTVTSTGKVLLAYPVGQTRHRGLYRATRSYHGYPVRCGVGLHEPSKLVVARLPTWHRYDRAYDLCGKPAERGLKTVRIADLRQTKSADHSHAHHDHGAAAPAPTMMAGPVTVIAAGPTKLSDLPASMRNDPWALLDAGRYRDALGVLESQGGNDAASRAGMAIATALSGDLDGGADALADLGNDLDALRSLDVSPALAARLTTLAGTLYADRPDAQRVLRALSGGDMPDSA